VSYRLTQKASQNSRGLKRLKHRIQTVFQKHKSYEVISGAALGLFHGADCYEEFRSLPQVAELIHDVHCGPEMLIPTAQVVKKTDTLVAGRHLRIGYCGRAIEIKGPIEWMEVCRRLYSDGVSFSAKWIGDGEHLCEMRQYRSKHRLEEVIELPGFMGDRANVMHEMRKFDLLLFCHRVAESPRVLIEALMSGTPIVGYTSPYARDLTCGGGGLLVEIGDVKGLADCVMRLTNDRRALADLITNAAEVGRGFSDEAVFAHRASLIRKHLPA
jgi:glycosyltransferase involved in cell wall biosynthesis